MGTASKHPEDMQFVMFTLGQEEYGADMATVSEIVRMAAITGLPDAPDFVEGVTNLRGEAITVIDLRKRFGIPGKLSSETRIIVTELNGNPVGFVVDAVEVLRLEKGAIEPPPASMPGLPVQSVVGLARLEERLVVLLNLHELLTVEEQLRLALLQEKRMRLEKEKDLDLLIWGTEVLIQVESEEVLLAEAGEMAMVLNLEAGFFLIKEEKWSIRAPFGRLKGNDTGWEEWLFEQLKIQPDVDYAGHDAPALLRLAPTSERKDLPWRNVLVQPLETHDGIIGELWLLDTGSALEKKQGIFAAFARNLGATLQSIRVRAKLEQLASTDALTGVLNRNGLLERLKAVISVSRRHKSSFLLLVLDLDGFKTLNDSQGHPVGDLALKTLARNLKDAIREHDVLARTGGDEFTLVLTEMAKSQEAIAVVKRLRDSMGLEQFDLGVSIGIAEFPSEGEDYEVLYRLADQRLYRSKHSGKGQIVFAE